MKKYLLSILFILSALFSFSQKEANIWYFGMNAGLDFNSGSPVSLSNGAMSTNEGCASIANKTTGQSLFYTDGTTVYNSDSLIMTNGTGLLGDGSSTQSAVIIPKPGSDSLFYIFTADAFVGLYSGNAGKFCYNIVDMSQSGGLGSVTVKNQVLVSGMTEKIAAHRHCNGHDIWVVAHQWGSNAFYAYLVTSSGISGPVISNSGTAHKNYGNDPYDYGAIGYMKISPDGTMIGVACDYFMHLAEVLPFDIATGMVGSPLLTDTSWTLVNSSGGPYGIAFSPDSRLLYIGVEGGFSVHQYDLNAGNNAAILATKVQVGSPKGAYGAGALQIAPDGKIYIAVTGTHTVAVLNNPDTPGVGCNYMDSAVILSGTCDYGLPDMAQLISVIPQSQPQSPFTATLTFPVCGGDSTVAFNDSIDSPVNCRWNFGDPSSGTSDTSTLQNPTHTFSYSGTFTIKLYLSHQCTTDSLIQTVTVSSAVNATVSPHDTTICQGNYVQLLASGGTSYKWSPGAGLSDSTIANPKATPSETTTYTVTALPAPCGDSTATVSITVDPSPPTPTIKQINDTILYCRSNPNYTSYQWSFDSTIIQGATDTLLIISKSGNYNLQVTNENGCNIAEGITIVLGIQSYVSENIIFLSPNPATNKLFVNVYLLRGKGTLKIYNVLGEVCQQSEITGSKSEINVSSLSAGIYFLQIKTESGNAVKKFVKE